MAESLYDHVFQPWRVAGETRVRASEATWRKPHKWHCDAEAAGVRRRVLVDVDVFDTIGRNCPAESELDEWRRDLFALIDATPHLDWLIRTRFPENVRRMSAVRIGDWKTVPNRRNVWIGVQFEDQATADDRVPKLLACRDLVPVLWVDADPLVGAVDFSTIPTAADVSADVLRGEYTMSCDEGVDHPAAEQMFDGGPKIDLVTIGGETGPNARPCNVEWIRSLVRQCADADVPCWVKRLGSNVVFDEDAREETISQWPDGVYFDRPEDNEEDRPTCAELRDKAGDDKHEWPDDIRVRQLPEVRT